MIKRIEELTNKIHLGKWEDVMPQIPDNSVDIVITSPPYCVDLGNNKFKKDAYTDLNPNKPPDRPDAYNEISVYDDNMPYTEYLDWMEKCFKECYRVLKSGGRAAINIGDRKQSKDVTHVDFIVRMREIGFLMLCPIVWNKGQIGSRFAWGSYRSPSMPCFPTPFEYILVVCKDSLRHEGDPNKITVTAKDFQTNANALWEFPPDTRMMERYGHPACFPEELPRRLIQQLTYEDDIVLDPFSGSGTTCAVAKKLRRRYIGIEMSKKYHTTSLRRLGEVAVVRIQEKEKKKDKTKEGDGMMVADWME